MNLISRHEDRDIGDTDVRKLVIANGGDAFETGDGREVLQAAVQGVDTKEAELGVRDFEVVHRDVFDKRSAAWATLNINGVGVRAKALTVLDENVAHAAGGLTANANAGPDGVIESAIGDVNVFAGDADGDAFHAAPTLEGDTVIARFKGAVIDDDVLAGVDVDAVSAAVDGDFPEGDVFAIDRMGRLHVVALSEDILDQHILTAVELHERRVADNVLAGDISGAV